jgi:hypothetical protein
MGTRRASLNRCRRSQWYRTGRVWLQDSVFREFCNLQENKAAVNKMKIDNSELKSSPRKSNSRSRHGLMNCMHELINSGVSLTILWDLCWFFSKFACELDFKLSNENGPFLFPFHFPEHFGKVFKNFFQLKSKKFQWKLNFSAATGWFSKFFCQLESLMTIEHELRLMSPPCFT